MDMDAGVIMRNKKDSKRIRQCRVVFSYKQDHEDELNLNVGDIIEILGEEEEGWWRGVLHGKIGVFPSNFVEEIHADKLKSSREDLNVSSEGDTSFTSPLKLAKILCEVKYSYKAQNEDELSLREGDIVTLLSKDGQDPGWWKGELNGVVGVFPDNFVVILPHNYEKGSERSPVHDPHAIRPSSIASQRKSLDNKLQNHSDKVDSLAQGDAKSTPPSVPSKKPVIAVKKSPSSGSSGGLFSGFKKKIVDVVDGATSSKSSFTPPKGESENSENVFDQVERISLLTDVRATRPKAPAGRRPPSMVFKEEEPTIPNGNAPVEPLNLDMVSEMATSTSSDTDASEAKPKLREWEKHKAPWLAEMKLNQAKRTSPSPGTSENRPKFDHKDEEPVKPSSEMSKSLTSITSTPPASKARDVDKTPLRPKPNLPNVSPSQRPATSPVMPSTDGVHKPTTPTHAKPSPPAPKASPSPVKTSDSKNVDQDVTITFKQYTDLVERIHKLELLVEKQNVIHAAAIDELKGKLQLETELRHMLQGPRGSAADTGGIGRRRVPWEGGYISLHIYNSLFLVATVLGFVISFLIYYWVDNYQGGFALDKVWTEVNWHPLLMFVGFVFMYAEAVLFDQTGRNLPKWCGTFVPNSDIYWFALIVKVICLILVGLGVQVVVDYNDFFRPSRPHLYTLHSWIGVLAIVLLCLDVLVDLRWFCRDAMSDLHRDVSTVLSWMLGTMAFLTSVNASITGFMMDAVASYGDLPASAVLSNVVGLLVLVFAMIVLQMSRKMREIGNLSGNPENVVVIVED